MAKACRRKYWPEVKRSSVLREVTIECALMSRCRADSFQEVKEKLQYHRTDTEQLINLYYNDRLKEQSVVDSAEYGVLSVRAYFHHDSLCIEVLNAKDVIPLDPNGE